MSLFDTWQVGPAEHHRLCLYGTLIALRGVLRPETDPGGYLRAYWEQLDGVPEAGDREAWRAAMARYEARAPIHLPLAALRAQPGVGPDGLDLLCATALSEEDARFGDLFAGLQADPERRRPTASLLAAMMPSDVGRPALRALAGAGVLVAEDPDAPEPDRTLRPAPGVWELARGDDPALAWWRLREPVDPADLIAGPELHERLERLPAALAGGRITTVVIRGQATTGRRTLLRVLAHRLGRRVAELHPDALGDGRRRHVAALAALSGALPVCVLDPTPGETIDLPDLAPYDGPLGIVMPEHGGLDGPRARGATTLTTTLPDAAQRAAHWRAAGFDAAAARRVAGELRMTGGHIRRTAGLARAHATLCGRDEPGEEDVRAAAGGLHRALFDTLCDPVSPAAGLDAVTCEPECRRELELLVARCRRRDELIGRSSAPVPASAGVRALFCGPSGTGKTLAARAVAGELGTDLYRIDISRVVDKFIGETEKNLARVFDRAEQADVVLLLDEGDALLTQRTAVTTSTDRYANLETNYLLARLEVFRGVLLVTTNAADRIDGAFRRRMDLVVDFAAPAAPARLRIWQAHLPGDHAVSAAALEDMAASCALHGGQIRTAAEHALLLAITNGGTLRDAHIADAVRREYRKAGEVCPLAEAPA